MIEIIEEFAEVKIGDKVFELYDITVGLSRDFVANQRAVTAERIVLDGSNITEEEIKDIKIKTIDKLSLEILKLSGFINEDETVEIDKEDLKKN